MAKVTIKYDINGASRPDNRFVDKSGRCAIDIILDEVTIPLTYVTATINGSVVAMPESDESGKLINSGDEQELTRELSADDELRILCNQKGDSPLQIIFAPSLNPIKATKNALSWIYDIPSYSSSTETGQTRNSLSGQSNAPNLYAAIPSRYGESIIYPDLIDNEAFSVYDADMNQVLTQFMSLGVGEGDWSELYLGDTQIGLIPNASVTRFDPVDGITTIDDYFYSRSVSQVSRSDLDGPGSRKATIAANSDGIFFTYDSTNDIGRIDVEGTNVSPAFDNYFDVDDVVTLNFADFIIGDDGLGGTAFYDLSGTYTVSAVGPRYIEFSDAATVVSDWQYIDGDFGTGETSYQSGSSNDNIIIQDTGTDLIYQGPFYTSIPARGFLLDFGFYSGLKKSVTLRVNYSVYTDLESDPIYSDTFDITYSGSSYDQQNYTYQFEYGSIGDNQYYFEVSVARTTAESTDAENPDTVKWDRFAALAQFANKEFSNNVSMIKVVIPYSSSALSPSANKVNIPFTRKTITYNTTTGEVDYTIAARTTFADALLHEYVIIHKRSPSELDLDSLYEISNRIGSPLNKFSYSFDDLKQSLEDKMTIICNVARVSFYWDGSVYRFSREEKRTEIPHIITRTDIAHPDERQYSRVFNATLPTSYDSVKLEYVYPDRNNEAAYIRLKYDSLGNVVTGLGVNPLSITLSGCRNRAQALNRAHIEIRKLIYQRWTVQDTLLKNGYLLDKNDFVQYTDVFRSNVYGGEILSVSGADLTLSSFVILESGVSYELWYNDEYMNTHGPFAIVNGDGERTKVITAVNESDLGSVYTRNGMIGSSIQVGSRFTIDKVVSGSKELFTVIDKDGVDDNHVNITMSGYDDRVFDYDD